MSYSAQPYAVEDALYIVEGVRFGCFDNEDWKVDYSLINADDNHDFELLERIYRALQDYNCWSMAEQCSVDTIAHGPYRLTFEYEGEEIEIKITQETVDAVKNCHCRKCG